MRDLVWEDPPGVRTGRGRPELPFWKQLRDRPGEWARTPVRTNNTSQLRRSHPDFEFTIRTIDGTRYIYARYIGEVA